MRRGHRSSSSGKWLGAVISTLLLILMGCGQIGGGNTPVRGAADCYGTSTTLEKVPSKTHPTYPAVQATVKYICTKTPTRWEFIMTLQFKREEVPDQHWVGVNSRSAFIPSSCFPGHHRP